MAGCIRSGAAPSQRGKGVSFTDVGSENICRDVSRFAVGCCPGDHVGRLCRAGAQVFRIGDGSDPAQVKTIGVETGPYRDVCMGCSRRVQAAGFDKQPERVIGQRAEMGVAVSASQFGSARTVLWIGAFVVAAGVVKHGE